VARILLLLLLLLALSALAFAPAPFPKPERRAGCADLKAMQGGWVLVRETYANGPPRPKRHLRASVAGRGITFSPEGDALAGWWAFTLAHGGKPKAIDLTLAGERRTIRAVYSLKGDRLVLCWNLGMEEVRPTRLPGNSPVACWLTFERAGR
jgi:uncharacterized protein (TIGR03067 family)